MIVKIPRYDHRLENGKIDFSKKSWTVFGDVVRLNVGARVVEEKCIAVKRHPTYDHTCCERYIGQVVPDDYEMDYRVALLHFDGTKEPVSVMFDTALFLCNDQGSTVDRF